MATTIGKLNFLVSADSSGVRTGLLVGEQAFNSFMGRITSAYQSLRAQFELNPFVQLGRAMLSTASSAETAKVQMEVLLGSAERATKMISDLRALDAKTPLGFGDLQNATVQLLNAEVSMEAIIPTLKLMSETSLGSSDKFQRMALAISQVTTAGRLMGGELRQMREFFNPLPEIAKRTGETMAQVTARMEAGNVSVREVIQAMEDATSATGRYNGLNEKMSKTVEGRYAALSSAVQILAIDIGEKLLPAMKALTDVGITVTKWIGSLGAGTIETTIKIGAMTAAFVAGISIAPKIIAAGMGIVRVLKAIATGEAVAQALGGPAGWAALATGLALAVTAGVAVNAAFADIETGAAQAKEAVDETRTSVANLFSDARKGDSEENGLVNKLKTVQDEIKATEAEYKRLREQIEGGGRGNFTSAAIRGTSAGIEAIAKTAQDSIIQRELVNLNQTLGAKLDALREQERAIEQAVKAKEPIRVTEARI